MPIGHTATDPSPDPAVAEIDEMIQRAPRLDFALARHRAMVAATARRPGTTGATTTTNSRTDAGVRHG